MQPKNRYFFIKLWSFWYFRHKIARLVPNEWIEWSAKREEAQVICNESGDSLLIEELLGLEDIDLIREEDTSLLLMKKIEEGIVF